MRGVAENVFYVGVTDRKIDLFEGMYNVPDGVTYNSYIIKDDKIAVIDTVDGAFGGEWLNNIEKALCGARPDYLIIQHMEPDHSACIAEFTAKYPTAEVVGNKKTFVMTEEFFGKGFPANRKIVSDGEKLVLGKHTLQFIFAPMVHWPEVMFTYDESIRTLFSADAFGKFGAWDGEWLDEARRYYIGIVGKYGVQVQAALKKVAAYKIEKIAPLHGPVLAGEPLDNALSAYFKWSGYLPELDGGVFIAYTSVYGHTAKAALLLAGELEKRGVTVKIADLARADWAECVAQAFRFPKLVIATTTYNAAIFPAASEFIERLSERGYKNRTVAFIENGSWASVAAKLMRAKFENLNGITFPETTVKIHSALNDESRAQIEALAAELVK